MEAVAKKEDSCWDQMQRSIDLLCSKLESEEEVQHQMPAQLDIATQTLAQSSKDQAALAQQIAATSDLVARLAAGN
jgi:hypothetical protein